MASLSLALILAVATFAPVQALLHRTAPVTWLFTGDSITQGAEHTHGGRDFAQLFEERVRWELRRFDDVVIDTGVSGAKAPDLLNDFQRRVAEWHPQVVFLMIGMNDSAAGRAGEEPFRNQVRALITRIRAGGAIPVLQTPNPIFTAESPARADLPRYVAILREVAQSEDVPLIDHYAAWESVSGGSPPVSWMDNAIHPNARGHAEMARTIFAALRIVLPSPTPAVSPTPSSNAPRRIASARDRGYERAGVRGNRYRPADNP